MGWKMNTKPVSDKGNVLVLKLDIRITGSLYVNLNN